ncbi:hypothetical protein OIU85_000777 [Salix viminalis]|uniref:Uncharacterized protein n=1 Tax=Salix viminalis TaxID=40686 RepID=A0A9Q0VK89_SALVM|nr:hypothetical protein OIU85_000777 [Salix viminalis]
MGLPLSFHRYTVSFSFRSHVCFCCVSCQNFLLVKKNKYTTCQNFIMFHFQVMRIGLIFKAMFRMMHISDELFTWTLKVSKYLEGGCLHMLMLSSNLFLYAAAGNVGGGREPFSYFLFFQVQINQSF